jgi:hypothetical protein
VSRGSASRINRDHRARIQNRADWFETRKL